MASPLQTRKIEPFCTEKGSSMLEWKARILVLLITVTVVTDWVSEFANNWNW
jgi:hypothetical protein